MVDPNLMTMHARDQNARHQWACRSLAAASASGGASAVRMSSAVFPAAPSLVQDAALEINTVRVPRVAVKRKTRVVAPSAMTSPFASGHATATADEQ